MKTFNYTGSSKIISRIANLLNRKAPMPLDANGDAEWGTSGQVLTTDGSGSTSWTTPQSGGGDVTDVEVNGTSVVDAQGVANVTVPTALADLSEDTTHRVVTDTEKTTWNGKVSDNPTFTEAATRANIASGESFATILGKIKKFFTDLKTVAFTGAYGDLSGTENVALTNVINTFSKNQVIDRKDGTASTIGESYFLLGNSTASGTDQNSQGILQIYGTGSYHARFKATNVTNNRVLEAPNASGTIALKEINNRFTETQSIDKANGTTTTVGIGQLNLGNNISEGTEGNAQGVLVMYGKGAYNAIIKASDIANSNKTFEFPNASGTLALKTLNNEFTASQQIDTKSGTTTTVGVSTLLLGNATAEGNDGNSQGRLAMYGKGTGTLRLQASNVTGLKEIELPNANGTVALREIGNVFSASQTIDKADGTTTSVKKSQLILGNNIPSGTDKNSQGALVLYGAGTKLATLLATNVTANRDIELPDASGTLGLKRTATDTQTSASGGCTSTLLYKNLVSVTARNATDSYYLNALVRPTNTGYIHLILIDDNFTKVSDGKTIEITATYLD